jgi:hypothetical protein
MCKVCLNEAPESPQHFLLECKKAKQAWEAYLRIWQKWEALDDVALSWPFILLGESVFERENEPPNIQGYHIGGFSSRRQPLNIFRSFIFYFLWTERCRMHFDSQYSSRNVLQQAWVATVKVGMATWKAINCPLPPGSLVFRIELNRPLGQSGVTRTSLGRTVLPLCGASWPLCIS